MMSDTQVYRKALVTGGAGFIGSHLARALLNEGLDVVVVDNLSVGKLDNVAPGVQFIEADLRDTRVIDQLLKGVDVVFHNAARVSIRSSMSEFKDDAETNILGTLSLLEAMGRSKAAKLIFASSMAVYSDSPVGESCSESFDQNPRTPYGISKLAGEKYCLQLGRDMGFCPVILRYFNTYGTGQAFTPYVGVVTIFIKRLLSGKPPIIFGDGLQVRDFVSVQDVVQANIKAMYQGNCGEIYNIGSGQGVSVKEIAELLVERIDPGIGYVLADEQPGETRNSIADISKANRELGYRPLGTLEKDIDMIIEYCKEN